MMLRQIVRLVMPALVAVGLALTPFAASAAESALGCETMRAMTGDMADCPSKQPAAPDCQEACTLVTACAAQWLVGTAATGSPVPALHPGDGTIRSGNDTFGGPLAEGPPARPPRT
jgi:hypothetical protein